MIAKWLRIVMSLKCSMSVREVFSVFKVHGKDSLSQFETVVDCLSERLLSPKVEQSSECPKPPRR